MRREVMIGLALSLFAIGVAAFISSRQRTTVVTSVTRGPGSWTYLDDQYVIKNTDKSLISDQDVCNFLVALTRARRKVLFVSSAQKDPTFLSWINQNRIKRLRSVGG